ncbi:uncharacterized protein LOC129846758 [Salvelinus fontinalis]|uniref:uncharacterized protein LOC129846758 n=1 Tax=Salvelinus fontinalis TaxID=8038 RepID=UPI002486C904|nr:uncharacterized protein LOC129846758 [Salvelinus fontinalis]
MITNVGKLWEWRRGYPYSIGDVSKVDRMSILWDGAGSTQQPCKGDEILLTIKSIKLSDTGTYTLGLERNGADTMGMFTITVLPKPPPVPTGRRQIQSNRSTTPGPTLNPPTKIPNPVQVINVKDITDSDQLGIETGYDGRENMWLANMRYTAKTLRRKDCVICGHARPVLATHPFALSDGDGWICILEGFYHVKLNSTLCKYLSLVFPEVPPQKAPWGVKAYEGNYSCITGTGRGVDYGRLPKADCTSNVTINATWPVKGLNQTRGVADVWWICGPNRRLIPILRGDWQGTCALACPIIPLTIIEVTANQLLGSTRGGMRVTNSLGDRDAMRLGPRGQTTSIPTCWGVPVGVQALSRNDGLWHLLPFIGPAIVDAKQTSWINYIYYNQQRFVNYTHTALTGMAEQLEATSRTARQNRLALDMILASQGGVCKMFGEQCCIPNNSSPDGSISKALSGLDKLSVEIKGLAGVEEEGLFSWFGEWFGRYTALVVTGFLTLIVVFLMLMCCAACIIPCLRKSFTDFAETALAEDNPWFAVKKRLIFSLIHYFLFHNISL